MTGMITPLLPKESVESPMLLETEFAPGMHLFIGATGKLSAERPGNGGFRIWKYESKDDAAAEVCECGVLAPVHVEMFSNGCGLALNGLPGCPAVKVRSSLPFCLLPFAGIGSHRALVSCRQWRLRRAWR
jgi:hypothetical protein